MLAMELMQTCTKSSITRLIKKKKKNISLHYKKVFIWVQRVIQLTYMSNDMSTIFQQSSLAVRSQANNKQQMTFPTQRITDIRHILGTSADFPPGVQNQRQQIRGLAAVLSSLWVAPLHTQDRHIVMGRNLIKRVSTLEPFDAIALQWRHNERHGVSNHQHFDCLPRRLFWRRSKVT